MPFAFAMVQCPMQKVKAFTITTILFFFFPPQFLMSFILIKIIAVGKCKEDNCLQSCSAVSQVIFYGRSFEKDKE